MRVTSKGQVTIPKRVREHLGVKPGSTVDFEVGADGRVTVVRCGGRPPKSRFARLRGSAPFKMTTDEIMAMTRGED